MPTLLDSHTVESVYRSYRGQVERHCRKFLHDPDEVADAVQEVFVKLFTKGGDFRAEANWMTWLYRVSTNVCLNYIRNTRHRRKLLADHSHVMCREESYDPCTADDRHMLQTLLNEVPPQIQRIVIYYYVLDMSQQEIAKLMGKSRQTVHKHLKKFAKLVHQLVTPIK